MATGNKKEENDTVVTQEIEQQPSEGRHEPPKGSHSCSFMTTLTPLIAVTALLLTGYTYYMSSRVNQNLAEENKRLTTELSQLQQQQTGLEQHLSSKTNEQQEASREIEQKIAHVSKQMQILSNQKGNQNQDWLLLKARYYLELAQINAHWNVSANDSSTTALLQQADTVLGQINTSDLFKIRQTIANEVMALKSANTLDIPGLLSQLDALQNSVAQLNVQTKVNPDSDSRPQGEQANDSSWKTQLHNSLNILSKLVVVRRNDEEIKPLLSPVYESILKESIRLNLQEAQWAILNMNQDAYQLALNHALTTLKRGFNEHLSNTTALINQIIKLQKVQLSQQKPEVGQALPLLNKLIEQKQITKPEEQNDSKEQEL